MKNKNQKALTVCKYVSASAFLLLANENNLNASAPIEEALHMASSTLPSPMFNQADLQADTASLIPKITGYINQDRFENTTTLIKGILDFVFAASFLKKEDGISFKAEIVSALLTYSMQYQEHSLETSLDTDAYNTLLMNWKKWSSCQYISARLNNEGARHALKEAMESKLELGVPEDSLYADQLKFALEYFTETRKALFGEIIESNDLLVYIPSKV